MTLQNFLPLVLVIRFILQNFCQLNYKYKNLKEEKEKELSDNISVSQVTFSGYRHPLKDLFKEGKMPTVKRGLYGGKLTLGNVSLEHLKPHSKGGKTTWRNLALAERGRNTARGSNPLADFLSWEMLEKYLSQFNFRIGTLFDGFIYQDQIRETCRALGVRSRRDIKKFPSGAKVEPEHKLSKKELRSLRNKAKKRAQSVGIQLEIEFPLTEEGQLNLFA